MLSIPVPVKGDNVHKHIKYATVSEMKYHFNRRIIDWLRKFLSGPFVILMVIPLVILDLCLEIYHRVTFPLLGIPCVPRRKYIRIDRHKLSYLTPAQKVFCMYCGYANGLLPYATKIAAETEAYWCGVAHKQNDDGFITPEHHKNFLVYGDEQSYTKTIKRAKAGEIE